MIGFSQRAASDFPIISRSVPEDSAELFQLSAPAFRSSCDTSEVAIGRRSSPREVREAPRSQGPPREATVHCALQGSETQWWSRQVLDFGLAEPQTVARPAGPHFPVARPAV